jgi:hypothetical protein
MDDRDDTPPGDRNRKAGLRRDVRAAAIGGLAATFVVAASFAPKLLNHPNEVNVHNSSTESALLESTTTMASPETTTTEPPTTTTVAPSTTTTTAARTTSTTVSTTTTTTTTTPRIIVPGAPASVVMTDLGDGKVRLTWDPVPGADSYAVGVTAGGTGAAMGALPCCTIDMAPTMSTGEIYLQSLNRAENIWGGSARIPYTKMGS